MPLLLERLQLELRGVGFELELAEADFHHPAAVDLESETALHRHFVVLEVRAEAAVDRRPDLGADRDDLVDVPVFLLDELPAVELLPLPGEEQAARRLLIQLPPPAGTRVGLAAFGLAALDRNAADLDAAVPAVGNQLDLA